MIKILIQTILAFLVCFVLGYIGVTGLKKSLDRADSLHYDASTGQTIYIEKGV